MAEPRGISRRAFTTRAMAFVGTIIGTVVGIPIIGYLVSPAVKASTTETWIPLGALSKYPVGTPTQSNFTLTQVNGWEKTVNSYSVYVLRGSNDSVEVLSNVCTHLGCRVTWHTKADEYICPCHDGRFSPTGKVISGPPPHPLTTYETKLDNGNLFIHVLES